MTATPRASLSLSLLLFTIAPACILGPDTEDTLTLGPIGTTDAMGGTDGNISATSTGTTIVPDALHYGDPCDLGPPLFYEETDSPPDADDEFHPQSSVLAPNDQCDGGICLFTYEDQLPADCDVDADCGTPDAVCSDDHKCVLSEAYVADNARCSHTCETAADCPDVPGCATGFSCGIVNLLGEFCCQPVCVCNDEISLGTLEHAAAQCAQGFPGCP